MARVLTAGATEKPRTQRTRDVDCADVVAGLWITLGALWMQGQRYGTVLGLMQRTRERLNDPRLRDHPKRPDAEARMEGWRLELRDLDAQAEGKRRALQRQWDGMPQRVHRFLRDSGGWPDGESGKEMAQGLWRYAIEGKPMPQGECPFVVLIGLGLALLAGGLG